MPTLLKNVRYFLVAKRYNKPGASKPGIYLGRSAFSFLLSATDFLSDFWALSWRKTALSYLLPPVFCPPLRQVQYLQSEGAEQPSTAFTVGTVTLPGHVVSDETNSAGCLYMKALISFTKISTGAIIATVKCRQFLSMGQLLKCLMRVKNSWTNC